MKWNQKSKEAIAFQGSVTTGQSSTEFELTESKGDLFTAEGVHNEHKNPSPGKDRGYSSYRLRAIP